MHPSLIRLVLLSLSFLACVMRADTVARVPVPVSQWQATDVISNPVRDAGGIMAMTWDDPLPQVVKGAFFGEGAWRLNGRQLGSVPHARAHGLMRDNLTIEAWISHPAVSGGAIIVRKQGQFSLDLNPESDGMRLRFLVWRGGVVQKVEVGPEGLIDDGKWHHLAGVLSGGSLELFVDGHSVAHSADAVSEGTVLVDPSNRPIWIGGIKEAAGGVVRGFTGLLSEVRLTGRALTPVEFGPRNPLTGLRRPDPSPGVGAEVVRQPPTGGLDQALRTAAGIITSEVVRQPPTGGLEKTEGLTVLRAGTAARPFVVGAGQVWRLGNWYYGQQEVLRSPPTAGGAQRLRLRVPAPKVGESGGSVRVGLIVLNEVLGSLDLELFVNGKAAGVFPGLRDQTTFKQFHTLFSDPIPVQEGADLDIELRGASKPDGDRINLLQLAVGDGEGIAAWKRSLDYCPALPPVPAAPEVADIAPYHLATGAPWNAIVYYSRRVRDQPETMRKDADLLRDLGFSATFQDLDSTINLHSLRLGLTDNAQFNSALTWQFDLFRSRGMQVAFNVYRLQLFSGEDFYSDLPLLEDSSGKPIGSPRYAKWMSTPVLGAPQTQERYREIWTDLARHFVETPAYLRVKGEDGALHPVFLLWSPFFFDIFDGRVASYDAWACAQWVEWQSREYGDVRWPKPPRNKDGEAGDAAWAAWQAFRGEYVADGAKQVAAIIREKVPGAWIAVLLKQHNFVQAVGKPYVSVGTRGLDPRQYGWADFMATESHRFGIYSVLADLDLARDMPSKTGRPIFIHYLVARENGVPMRYPWTKRELVGSMLLRRALALQYGYNERDDFAGFAYFERPDTEAPDRMMWPETLPDIRSGNAAYNALFDRAQATPPAASALAIHLPSALYTVGDNREDWNTAITTPHRELLRRNLAPRWLLNLAGLDDHPEITALVMPDPLSLKPDEVAALGRFTRRGGRLVFISIPEAGGDALEKIPAGDGKVMRTTLAEAAAPGFGDRLAAFVGISPQLGSTALDVETGLIGRAGDQVLVAVNHAAEPRETDVTIDGVIRRIRVPAHDSVFFSVGGAGELTAMLPPPSSVTVRAGPTLRDADVWTRYRDYVFLSSGEGK